MTSLSGSATLPVIGDDGNARLRVAPERQRSI
jgi:hypothetical protein